MSSYELQITLFAIAALAATFGNKEHTWAAAFIAVVCIVGAVAVALWGAP